MTEEQLRRVTIGEPIRHDAPITLCEYDPTWPELFSREERRIRKALGDRVIQLEHVGSTSVPGLAAKPIIDVLLVVADCADESTYVPALEAEGYVLRIREPDWYQHRLLKGPDTNLNLHVFSTAAAEIDRMLSFRDLLRTNPETWELYDQTKRELARRTWKYVQNYADAKSEIIEQILRSTTPTPPESRSGGVPRPRALHGGRLRARGDPNACAFICRDPSADRATSDGTDHGGRGQSLACGDQARETVTARDFRPATR
ncbi:MAG: GrpB family protein [Thermoplasmata archaeon]